MWLVRVRLLVAEPDSSVGWGHEKVLPLQSRDKMLHIQQECDSAPRGAESEDMGPVTWVLYYKVRGWLCKMCDKY